MTIQLIFKIAAVGILVSVLNQILKHSGREDQAFLVSLAGLLVVLFWIVPYIAELFETIQKLFRFRRGLMVKIALAGIVVVLCALLLKNEKAEYAVFISMSGCLMIFLFGISKLEVILTAIGRLEGYLGAGSEYLPILLRIVGITYLAEFAADLCRDAGFPRWRGRWSWREN